MASNPKYKTFKEYYQNEDYKRKHLEKITEKIPCECGQDIMRVYMSRHMKTKKHLNLVKEKRKEQTDKIRAIFEKFKDHPKYNEILEEYNKENEYKLLNMVD